MVKLFESRDSVNGNRLCKEQTAEAVLIFKQGLLASCFRNQR